MSNTQLDKKYEYSLFLLLYSYRKSKFIILMESDIKYSNFIEDMIQKAISNNRCDELFQLHPEEWMNFSKLNEEILKDLDIVKFKDLLKVEHIAPSLLEDLMNLYKKNETIDEIEYILELESKISEQLFINSTAYSKSLAAKHSIKSDFSIAELSSEGNLAIHKAICNFDINLGTRFGPHCYNWIMAKIRRYVEEHNNLISIPVSIQDSYRSIFKFIKKYKSEHGSDPSNEVLQDTFGVDVDNIIINSQHQYSSLSVQDNLTEDDSELTDYSNIKIEDIFSINKLKKILIEELSKLDDLTRYVVENSIGINNLEQKTLIEIANTLNISSGEVSYIKKKGINSLKKNMSIYKKLYNEIETLEADLG